MIEVERLTKLYAEFPAVRDLSFHLRAGQILGLVGPNGAGKTTTLSCLTGVLRPSSGTIRISGHDLLTQPIAAKQLLAFVPDEPALFPYLSVEEHLLFASRLYGVADALERIPPLLEEMELADKRRALPGELSRGMKQKLALSMGLIHDPRALILDEPLTGLDPASIRRTKHTIVARAGAGTAVILSSHLLSLVEELCTHILVLQKGRRVAFGTPAEIVADRPQLAGRGLEEVFLALTAQEEEQGESSAP
ncbi:MAG: ABC transporter ATP-binding protein [Gemmatimonadetes bacterium]|nr:ABC transporter ATP-binding protein [Gemmatimonadota bacterium]